MTSVLVRLYPSAFRDQWGTALAEDAAAQGWRSAPNLVAGLVDMWLHPAIWPTAWRGQRGGRVAAMAAMITMASWLVAHLATAHPHVLNGCAATLAVGLLLVAPLPRLKPRALLAIAGRSLRLFAGPVLLGAVVVIVVNNDITVLPRVVLLAGWWGAWLLALVQGGRLIASLGPDVVRPPGPWRIRIGIVALAAAAGTAGSAVLVSVLPLGVGLLAVACVPLLALRDLAGAR
jgi:hypothetical protein